MGNQRNALQIEILYKKNFQIGIHCVILLKIYIRRYGKEELLHAKKYVPSEIKEIAIFMT